MTRRCAIASVNCVGASIESAPSLDAMDPQRHQHRERCDLSNLRDGRWACHPDRECRHGGPRPARRCRGTRQDSRGMAGAPRALLERHIAPVVTRMLHPSGADPIELPGHLVECTGCASRSTAPRRARSKNTPSTLSPVARGVLDRDDQHLTISCTGRSRSCSRNWLARATRQTLPWRCSLARGCVWRFRERFGWLRSPAGWT